MKQSPEDPVQADPQAKAGEKPELTETTIPVWQEELQVGSRKVETGKGVRIRKTVSEEERIIDPPLMHEELSVETVPIGEWVESGMPPQARYEGDTFIVPVLEEVVVVQKRLRLKEEMRITRRKQETRTPQSVMLRSERKSRWSASTAPTQPAKKAPTTKVRTSPDCRR